MSVRRSVTHPAFISRLARSVSRGGVLVLMGSAGRSPQRPTYLIAYGIVGCIYAQNPIYNFTTEARPATKGNFRSSYNKSVEELSAGKLNEILLDAYNNIKTKRTIDFG